MGGTGAYGDRKKTGRPDGWWYPWALAGIMAVAIAANGVMIWFAQATFSGLETERAYDKGLAYNRDLEGAAASARLGWRAEVAFVSGARADDAGAHLETTRAGTVRVRLVGPDGKAVDGAEAELLVLRPAQAGLDLKVPLVSQGEGLFTAGLALPLPGQWTVRVHAWRGRDVFQDSVRIVVP